MRISKALSHLGICSRRSAEELISKGRVKINNCTLTSPIYFVQDSDQIYVDGKMIIKHQSVRLWKYFKPKGIITTHKDSYNRTTLFQILPKNIGRVISIGRLDYNTEGLILLTNNGDLARKLELPKTQIRRVYLCKAYGIMPTNMLIKMHQGITINQIKYKPITAILYKKKISNSWYKITLYEGKNNEIRNIFAYFNLQVSRLIRVDYGDYSTHNMQSRDLVEINSQEFSQYL